MKRKDYHKIKNISQLRREKRILEKKIKIRGKILNRRLKTFKKTITPDYLYTELLKSAKMEDSILAMAPQALKLKIPVKNLLNKGDNKKKLLVTLFSAIGAAITSLFAFNSRKKQNGTINEQLFI